jgi:hypothetical protein
MTTIRTPCFATLAAAAIALHAGTARAAETVALLPTSGSNVAPQVLEASRDILKDHLQRTGQYTVVTPGGSPTADEPTAVQASHDALAVGATQAVVLRITHIGTAARVRLTIYAAQTGQVVYWDSIPINGGPEELDPVLQRLVHALVTGRPVHESAEIDTVTDKETQNLNRRAANKSFGVHILTLMPFNTPDREFRPVPGLGLFWLYDARSWLADIAVDYGHKDGSTLWSLSLGGYYPLSREDFAPYVGGAIRLSSLKLGGRGSGGVSFQPTVGFVLGRLSSVQIRGEVGYLLNTFSEQEDQPANLATALGPAHFSHGFVLSVGIGF